MKRLTKRDGKYMDCLCENCEAKNQDFCDCGFEVWARLKQYEDAEEQGLLVRLPCKVGDSFFAVRKFCDEYGELEEPVEHWDSDCYGCNLPCNGKLKVVERKFNSIHHNLLLMLPLWCMRSGMQTADVLIAVGMPRFTVWLLPIMKARTVLCAVPRWIRRPHDQI